MFVVRNHEGKITEFFPNTKPLTSKEQQTIDELKAIALEYDVAIIPGSSRTRLAGAEPVKQGKTCLFVRRELALSLRGLAVGGSPTLLRYYAISLPWSASSTASDEHRRVSALWPTFKDW